ncbi:hypothetical protein REPUB_Repub13aG0209200 [Reevesia pubescens]
MAMSTVIYNHFPTTLNTSFNRIPAIRSHQKLVLDHPKPKMLNPGTRLAESLSHLLHLHLHIEPPSRKKPQFSNWDLFSEEKHNTPTVSPKEIIADKWRDIHGSADWDNLLDPLHPWLRREIVKYGELAQATYDAFDFDSFSEYCGSCRYNSNKLFEKLGLNRNGYKATKYIYAMSHIEMPQWLERSNLMETWSKDSNWMGYVAVSDDEETCRIGRRDIAVAWRGTVAPSELYEDFQRNLEPIGLGDSKVEHGFLCIYTSKNESTRYNKSSASEQVIKEVKKLVTFYEERGEEVSLTITGHSLGGALALLNAYEAAATLPGLPVSVIFFGAPRVGNSAFRDELVELGVKALRVVIKQDLVPRMPGIVFNESLQRFDDITGTLEWIYTHVGTELSWITDSEFRSDSRRDIALVNKACDMLVDELRIPHFWYQLANKGLVCNEHGRWVKPRRDPEDIPSPIGEASKKYLKHYIKMHNRPCMQVGDLKIGLSSVFLEKNSHVAEQTISQPPGNIEQVFGYLK